MPTGSRSERYISVRDCVEFTASACESIRENKSVMICAPNIRAVPTLFCGSVPTLLFVLKGHFV